MAAIKVALKKLVFCLLCCATSGCGYTPPPPGLLRIAISHDPLSLDPRQASLSKDISIAKALYEGLVREKDHTPRLALASHYTVSDDLCVYTFHLKPSVWSNGDPVTAYDFEMSIKQMCSQEVESTSIRLLSILQNAQEVYHRLQPVEQLGVKALDAKTLQFTLAHPAPYFLELLAHPIFFPVHVSVRKRKGSYISNGPFVIEAYQPQQRLILQKNPLYHDSEAVKLKAIHFQIVTDGHTAVKMLQQHVIDWIGAPWSSSIAKEEQYHLDFHSYPVLGTTLLICNFEHPAIRKKHLRKALAEAINRQALLQFVNGQPAQQFLHPIVSQLKAPFSSQSESEVSAKENLRLAIEELGDDIDLEIIYPLESSCLHAVVQAIQQQIKQVLSLPITIRGLEYHCFLDRRQRGDFTLATGKWIAEHHNPVAFLNVLKGKELLHSLTNWQNPTYETLLSRLTVQEDPQALCTAEKILHDELPIIPLYHFEHTYAIHPKVSHIYGSLLGDVDLKEAEITE